MRKTKQILIAFVFACISSANAQTLKIGTLGENDFFHVRDKYYNNHRNSTSYYDLFSIQNSEGGGAWNKKARISVNNKGLKLGLSTSGSWKAHIDVRSESYSNSYLSIQNANFGIATSTPKALLSLGSETSRLKLALYDDNSGGDRYGFGVENGGLFRFQLGGGGGRFGFFDGDNSNANELMSIWPSGAITIGTTCVPETEYRLAVKGGIIAEKVKVEVSGTGWCDYVFADDYDLMSLAELRSFIKKNRHLPGIPAEQEVIEEGVELLELNTALLKKVEELTLYVLKLDEDNRRLRSELELTKEQ